VKPTNSTNKKVQAADTSMQEGFEIPQEGEGEFPAEEETF
jgi:hypothetical protein